MLGTTFAAPSISTLSATIVAVHVVLAPCSSLAYILPADAVLNAVATRRAQLGFSSIVAEGTYRGVDGTPEQIVWEAAVPGKGHRVERRGPTGTTVILTHGTKRWAYSVGAPATPAAKISPDILTAFLFTSSKDSGSERGSAFLRAYGIDAEIVSLARLEERVVYVIGAKPWESEKPQLWIDKEYSVPTRLITIDKSTGVTSDLRLLEYGSASTGEWYPRRIELWRAGKLIESTVYKSARLNEPVDANLFRPPS